MLSRVKGPRSSALDTGPYSAQFVCVHASATKGHCAPLSEGLPAQSGVHEQSACWECMGAVHDGNAWMQRMDAMHYRSAWVQCIDGVH